MHPRSLDVARTVASLQLARFASLPLARPRLTSRERLTLTGACPLASLRVKLERTQAQRPRPFTLSVWGCPHDTSGQSHARCCRTSAEIVVVGSRSPEMASERAMRARTGRHTCAALRGDSSPRSVGALGCSLKAQRVYLRMQSVPLRDGDPVHGQR